VILVDTNVLLDLVTDDPDWAEWSLARLEEAALAGPVLINDIVYPETSIRIGAHAAVEGWLLLTRGAGRYRRYFPKVALIAPPA